MECLEYASAFRNTWDAANNHYGTRPVPMAELWQGMWLPGGSWGSESWGMVLSQSEAQQHLEQTLGNLFPMKKGSEKYQRTQIIYCCSELPDLGLDTRRIKDLLGDLWPSDQAASTLSQAHCDIMAIPSEFSPLLWKWPQAEAHRGFWHSCLIPSDAVTRCPLWSAPTPALLSECPEHLQPVEGWWRASHQQHGREGGGGSSWLSAKPRHSAFSFLVSALCWKVSTYAPVSMATAFLAFLL